MINSLLVVLSLSLIGCSGLQSSAAAPLSSAQRVEHLGAITVALVHTYHGKTRSMCTGTFISQHIILTAQHCVAGLAAQLGKEQLIEQAEAQGMDPDLVGAALALGLVDAPEVDPTTANFEYIIQDEVTDVYRNPLGSHATHVRILSQKFDLALLDTVGEVPSHGIAVLAAHTPVVGEPIYLMGHQAGIYWSYMTGIVSAYRRDMSGVGVEKDGPFIQVQAPMYHGNSGGGIFNANGELVGMADFISPAPDAGFGIHLETIRGFLAGQHLINLSL